MSRPVVGDLKSGSPSRKLSRSRYTLSHSLATSSLTKPRLLKHCNSKSMLALIPGIEATDGGDDGGGVSLEWRSRHGCEVAASPAARV